MKKFILSTFFAVFSLFMLCGFNLQTLAAEENIDYQSLYNQAIEQK